MHPPITSLHNARIKSVLALEKARERKMQGLFTIEGRKEIDLAIAGGYTINSLYFCEDLISAAQVKELGVPEKRLFPVNASVFGKLAVRESSGGLLAVAEAQVKTLEQLALPPCPLVLVLESVEKPGNLGAILRTADAAGVGAVICCDLQTDLHNPNVIRSSLGCVFTVPVAIATTAETLAWLKQKKLDVYATHLRAARPYHQVDYRLPCAVVMGTEATGISAAWAENSTANIVIPMHGQIDSMNVSTAAAVIVFEAVRQRQDAPAENAAASD